MKLNYLIQEHLHDLTKSEKKVADYLLSLGEKVIYSTMTEVKEGAEVGDATIVRFCQKLGFNGFADLKIELAKEDFSEKNHSEKEQNFADKSTQSIQEALTMTQRLLDIAQLKKAVQLIGKAEKIYIFGVGSSSNTGNDLEAMFLRVGVQAHAISDPHFQAQVASLLSPSDLVIGLSLSGKTKDTYDSLKIAQKNQVKIIAITNYLLSPIAQLADIVLQTAIEEFFNGASLAGKVSQLFLCDLLIRAFEIHNHIDTLELREKVLRSIPDKSLD